MRKLLAIALVAAMGFNAEAGKSETLALGAEHRQLIWR